MYSTKELICQRLATIPQAELQQASTTLNQGITNSDIFEQNIGRREYSACIILNRIEKEAVIELFVCPRT